MKKNYKDEKPAKDKKTEKKVVVASQKDQELINYVKDCHEKGTRYRDIFKDRWDKIESQIRCQHPSDWAQKEDWQTKVFIPQQAKTSETAFSYLDKIIFGQPRFYDIQGMEANDRAEVGHLMDLIDNVFNRGNFFFENEFVERESVDIGTSFIKLMVNPNRTGISFVWRSPYYLTFDPSCGHDFYKAKWVTDEFKRPIQKLIDESTGDNPLYKREAIEAILEQMESECSEAFELEGDKALMTVRGFDGTSMTIPSKYSELAITEFWGKAKVAKQGEYEDKKGNKKKIDSYQWEDRIIALANDKFLLRNVENDYGFIPVAICRTKPRKYDTYALGYCDTSVDLQELMNSMNNLGFDSLKICSMDIAMIDESMVKVKDSIEYKPMAVWRFKGNPNEAVKLSRQGISALGEIIRGITVLDQFQQEASGVLRSVQGAETGGSSTLGEYQAKLAMADNRFLKAARFTEKDYVVPLVKMVFKIMFNPKFFNQKLIDRILGTRTEEVMVSDQAGNQLPQQIQVPKLDFNKIASAGDMGLDFKAVGITQYSSRLEVLQKLKELLITVVKTPELKIISKIDEIFKKTLQAAEIPDYEDILKSDEEIKAVMNQIYSGVGQGGQPGQPGGQPGMPPGMPQPQPQGAM